MSYKLTYKTYGERAILIEWPQRIDADILMDILSFKEKIQKIRSKPIVCIKSSYCSLLIYYKEKPIDYLSEIAYIDKIYEAPSIEIKSTARLWKVPVCYDPVFGLDLELISKEKNISKSDIVKLHKEPLYRVYFVGFLPGFLYLGGLSERLQIPRKSTPRLQVEKGAVAIGGNQTGVYPNTSPGGWHIIGNSPVNFFDVTKEKPTFAKAGDRVQFYSISLKEYQDIKILVDANVYMVESEVLDD